MIEFLIGIFYGIWWGFLRRWFGGLFPEEKYKILGNRGLQTTVMIISMLPIYTLPFISWLYVLGGLAMTLWIQFQFWSRGHGATFADMGRTKNPDLSRYDRWYRKVLDFIWDKSKYLKEKYKFFNWLFKHWGCEKYGYSYDMWYHGMRYTCPMIIPAILLHWTYILIGIASPFIYEMNLRFYEKYKFNWMNYAALDRANKLSEIMYGFIFGIGIYLIKILAL